MSAAGQVAAWIPGPLTTARAQVAVAGALVADARSAWATETGVAWTWSGDAAEAAAVRHAQLSARLERLAGRSMALNRLSPTRPTGWLSSWRRSGSPSWPPWGAGLPLSAAMDHTRQLPPWHWPMRSMPT